MGYIQIGKWYGSACVKGYRSTAGCEGERGKGWMEQRNVTENSRHWGGMEECPWSQDEFRKSGLRLREEIYDG